MRIPVIVDTHAWVPTSSLREGQLERLQERLTLKRTSHQPGASPPLVRLFAERFGAIGLPRAYFERFQRDEHDVDDRTSLGVAWSSDIVFHGELFGIQRTALRSVLTYLGTHFGCLLEAAPGFGKCLGLGTPVLRLDGTVVAVENLRAGDVLMGPDSQPRRVLSTTRGEGSLFRINPIVGTPWVCNDAHILTLVHTTTGEVSDIALRDWLTLTPYRKSRLKQFSPPHGVEFPESNALPLDPYFVGVWYGDGTKSLTGVAITKPDPEILALCCEVAERYGLRVRTEVNSNSPHPCPTHHIVGVRGPNPLLDVLRKVVGDGVELPLDYLTASREDRLQFFAGLLDTDGSHANGCYDIVQKLEGWARGIAFLARSLGFRAVVTPKVVQGVTYWRVILSGDFSVVPLRISRKKPRVRLQRKCATRTGFSVEPLGEGAYAGFTLDGDGRFLLGDFTVTHNTVSACALMAALGRRAMVVVHKEFLANQWARQIHKFLPKARIGRIQGDVCDTDADITVAMVHTLVNREWPEDFLRQFGVVIGDEVHRSAAETWTPATCIVPARYRVGLSATFRRKDGCERVFFDHIGPVVFSHRVPRMLPTIHRVNTGWAPAVVGMDRVRQITAMVRSKSRNKFIAKLVASACAKGRKVMILSERLEHLRELAKLLPKGVTRDFYVGGRSEEELGKAELVQVVLATRQNVEEGLDIPALDTLFYATPVVDPEQSGGRVLRPYEGKRCPAIVDLRDGGPMLEAFARKRDEWYRTLQWEVAPRTTP